MIANSKIEKVIACLLLATLMATEMTGRAFAQRSEPIATQNLSVWHPPETISAALRHDFREGIPSGKILGDRGSSRLQPITISSVTQRIIEVMKWHKIRQTGSTTPMEIYFDAAIEGFKNGWFSSKAFFERHRSAIKWICSNIILPASFLFATVLFLRGVSTSEATSAIDSIDVMAMGTIGQTWKRWRKWFKNQIPLGRLMGHQGRREQEMLGDADPPKIISMREMQNHLSYILRKEEHEKRVSAILGLLLSYGLEGVLVGSFDPSVLRSAVDSLQEYLNGPSRYQKKRAIVEKTIGLIEEGIATRDLGRMLRRLRTLNFSLSGLAGDFFPNWRYDGLAYDTAEYLARWMLHEHLDPYECWETLEVLLGFFGKARNYPEYYSEWNVSTRKRTSDLLSAYPGLDNEAYLCAALLRRAISWYEQHAHEPEESPHFFRMFPFYPLAIGDSYYLLTLKLNQSFILKNISYSPVLVPISDDESVIENKYVKQTLQTAAFYRTLSIPGVPRPQVLKRLSKMMDAAGISVTPQEYWELADSVLWNSDPEVAAGLDTGEKSLVHLKQSEELALVGKEGALAKAGQNKEKPGTSHSFSDTNRLRSQLERNPISRLSPLAFPDLLDDGFQIITSDQMIPSVGKKMPGYYVWQMRLPLRGRDWGLNIKGGSWPQRAGLKNESHIREADNANKKMKLLKDYLKAIETRSRAASYQALLELLRQDAGLLILYINSLYLSQTPYQDPETLINRLERLLMAAAGSDQNLQAIIRDIFNYCLQIREACSGITLNMVALSDQQQEQAIQNLGAWQYPEPLYHAYAVRGEDAAVFQGLQWCYSREKELPLVTMSQRFNRRNQPLVLLLHEIWLQWYGNEASMELYKQANSQVKNLPDFAAWWAEKTSLRLSGTPHVMALPLPTNISFELLEIWRVWPKFLGKRYKSLTRRNEVEEEGDLASQMGSMNNAHLKEDGTSLAAVRARLTDLIIGVSRQVQVESVLLDLVYLALHGRTPDVLDLYVAALEKIEEKLFHLHYVALVSLYQDVMLRGPYLARLNAGQDLVSPPMTNLPLAVYMKGDPLANKAEDLIKIQNEEVFEKLLMLEGFGDSAPGFTGQLLNELFSPDYLGQLLRILSSNEYCLAYRKYRTAYGFDEREKGPSPLMQHYQGFNRESHSIVFDLVQEAWGIAFGSQEREDTFLGRLNQTANDIRFIRQSDGVLWIDWRRVSLLEKEGLGQWALEQLILNFNKRSLPSQEREILMLFNQDEIKSILSDEKYHNQWLGLFLRWLTLRYRAILILKKHLPEEMVTLWFSGSEKTEKQAKSIDTITRGQIEMLRKSGVASEKANEILYGAIKANREAKDPAGKEKLLAALRAAAALGMDPTRTLRDLAGRPMDLSQVEERALLELTILENKSGLGNPDHVINIFTEERVPADIMDYLSDRIEPSSVIDRLLMAAMQKNPVRRESGDVRWLAAAIFIEREFAHYLPGEEFLIIPKGEVPVPEKLLRRMRQLVKRYPENAKKISEILVSHQDDLDNDIWSLFYRALDKAEQAQVWKFVDPLTPNATIMYKQAPLDSLAGIGSLSPNLHAWVNAAQDTEQASEFQKTSDQSPEGLVNEMDLNDPRAIAIGIKFLFKDYPKNALVLERLLRLERAYPRRIPHAIYVSASAEEIRKVYEDPQASMNLRLLAALHLYTKIEQSIGGVAIINSKQEITYNMMSKTLENLMILTADPANSETVDSKVLEDVKEIMKGWTSCPDPVKFKIALETADNDNWIMKVTGSERHPREAGIMLDNLRVLGEKTLAQTYQALDRQTTQQTESRALTVRRSRGWESNLLLVPWLLFAVKFSPWISLAVLLAQVVLFVKQMGLEVSRDAFAGRSWPLRQTSSEEFAGEIDISTTEPQRRHPELQANFAILFDSLHIKAA